METEMMEEATPEEKHPYRDPMEPPKKAIVEEKNPWGLIALLVSCATSTIVLATMATYGDKIDALAVSLLPSVATGYLRLEEQSPPTEADLMSTCLKGGGDWHRSYQTYDNSYICWNKKKNDFTGSDHLCLFNGSPTELAILKDNVYYANRDLHCDRVQTDPGYSLDMNNHKLWVGTFDE